jgi:hypothetical protein
MLTISAAPTSERESEKKLTHEEPAWYPLVTKGGEEGSEITTFTSGDTHEVPSY